MSGWEAMQQGAPDPFFAEGREPRPLTREILDAAVEAVLKQGSHPRHDCRFDGHVLQWNPWGFAYCIYCTASEAETERPR